MQETGKKLNLGIIGISPGNGHPYSWSSIFNGFKQNELKKCPYPSIVQYLKNKRFPEDFLECGRVTHVWTQSLQESRLISKISKIPNIVENLNTLPGKVDAVLLARDDAENHLQFSKIFIEKGIPIFIDKPLALSEKIGKYILELEKWEGQIFTCSALKYADEMKLTEKKKKSIGKLKKIIGTTPNSWNKYSIHVIEPIIDIIGEESIAKKVKVNKNKNFTSCEILWDNDLITTFISTGEKKTRISIKFIGEFSSCENFFSDPFNCFKKSLETFCLGVTERKRMFDKSKLFKVLEIIEMGLG